MGADIPVRWALGSQYTCLVDVEEHPLCSDAVLLVVMHQDGVAHGRQLHDMHLHQVLHLRVPRVQVWTAAMRSPRGRARRAHQQRLGLELLLCPHVLHTACSQETQRNYTEKNNKNLLTCIRPSISITIDRSRFSSDASAARLGWMMVSTCRGPEVGVARGQGAQSGSRHLLV